MPAGPRAAVGVRSPHVRRPGLHFGSRTDDLGLPEGHGRLHQSAMASSSVSTPASTANWCSAWNSVAGCGFRLRSLHASRSCARTRISTASHAKAPDRSHSTVCATGQVVRGCGSAIIPTRKNLRRWACRSARWSRLRLPTSRCRSATRRRLQTMTTTKPDVDLTDGDVLRR